MQLEPYENKSGHRVWLNEQEQEQLLNYYDEDPEKQLALELLLDGLRAEEVPRVSFEDFRQMETDREGWMLHVWESKTDYRECPVSIETKKKAKMLKNIQDLRKGDPLIQSTKRTVQRWVTAAAEAQEGKQWGEVSAHDCRRTWATHTYWRLPGDRSREIVMAWGGWDDVQTFVHNYLGKVPDSVAIEAMEDAGLL